MTINDLIERVIQATGPDRELDLAIEIALRQCDPSCIYDAEDDCAVWNEPREFGSTVAYERLGQFLPAYTASLDAALTLAGDNVVSILLAALAHAAAYFVEFRDRGGHILKMLPIFVCIAALKARSQS